MTRSPLLPAGFRSIILDRDQLRVHPCLQPLHNMVNDAFRRGSHVRFRATEDMFRTLGIHARCCVVFREEDTNMVSPVATAMLKFYNPAIGNGPIRILGDESLTVNGSQSDSDAGYSVEPEDLLSIVHWEPVAVVTLRGDPSLERIGLATFCVHQLKMDLFLRMDKASKIETQCIDAEKENQDPSPSPQNQCLTFWISATESAAGYWERRGFKVVNTKVYGKGTWGYETEMKVVTLKKEENWNSLGFE